MPVAVGYDVAYCRMPDCGEVIHRVRKPGRPRTEVCEACQAEINKRRDAERVKRCKGCGHFLAKPKTKGRPPHLCPICLLERAADKSNRQESWYEIAIRRGYCDSRCMTAELPECNCFCDGYFHQAGLAEAEAVS
jgi:hypothetical protein